MNGFYPDGRPVPPESEWVLRLFFREGHFYAIPLPVDCDLNEHAELNPGTLRIENIAGDVLWPEGTKQ